MRSSRNRRVYYGWWVVSTAAVGLFWGPPVTVFTFSVFFKPLMQHFHAGRSAISMGYTLHSIAGAISAPLVGWLIDRYGTRRVILPAAAMFASILLSAKALSSSVWQLYFFYVALGFLGTGTGPIPYCSVVTHWFDRHRGLAIGLTMLGIGLGAIVMPPFAQRLIGKFGWRAAYSILGSGVLLISMPVAGAFLKETPRDLGLALEGVMPANTHGEVHVTGLSWHDAWHTSTFWIAISAFFLVGGSVQGCVVHMAAILSDRGTTIEAAALGSSLVGAALLIGRVGSGYLLDRCFAPDLAAVFFGGTAVGIGFLSSATGLQFVGAFFVGLGLGAEVDIIAYLTSRYFGLRSFGKIYGFAMAVFLFAGALGPLAMGAGFDLTGSYHTPLAVLFTSTVVAAILMTRLGPYRYQASQPDGKQPAPQVRKVTCQS
jgi:MFS family permease